MLYGDRFCGIEHTVKNNEPIIYCSILKKTKKEILIEHSFSVKSTDEIFEKLKKSWPVVLIINDDQVLTKSCKISNEQNNHSKPINVAFPNINADAFYYEMIDGKNTNFISICRKAYVDEVLMKYSEQKINVLGFSLGNMNISHILNFFRDEQIYTSNSNISVPNNMISSIELENDTNEVDYDINGLDISSNYLLSCSGALNIIINTSANSSNFENRKNELLSEFKHSRFFHQFLKMGLVSILLILLVNFLFFNCYFEKVNTLRETSQLNQITKNDIVELKTEVEKSQKLTEDILKNNTSKSSFYVNTIITSLPQSILLSEFNYQPLQRRIKKDKPVTVDKNRMIFSGTSNNSNLYSKWITKLEKIEWIDHIEVIDYSDISKNISNFNLKVYLKDE